MNPNESAASLSEFRRRGRTRDAFGPEMLPLAVDSGQPCPEKAEMPPLPTQAHQKPPTFAPPSIPKDEESPTPLRLQPQPQPRSLGAASIPPHVPIDQDPPPSMEGNRSFGVARRHQEILTIPLFSEMLSSWSLDRVIGISGITNEIIRLFLLTAFPNNIEGQEADRITAKLDARLNQALEACELHPYYRRTLRPPCIDISDPQNVRSGFLNLSGRALGADSVAVISDAISLRLPVKSDGYFAGIFPLRGEPSASVWAYNLHSTQQIRSEMVSLTIPPRTTATVSLPAFDVLGVLDDLTKRVIVTLPLPSVQQLKIISTREIQNARRTSNTSVGDLISGLTLSRSQQLIAQQ